MPPINDIIENFINFGRSEIAQIMTLNGTERPQPIHEYQKLLFSALIDSYAGYAYPRKNPRERFLAFIRQHGAWPDHDRVSLTHLSELLRRSPEPEFQKLRTDVRARIAKWHKGSIIHLASDPTVSEIASLWPQDKDFKEPLLGITMDRLTHASLLYAYRCSLVHELKSPGFSWHIMENHNEPLYVSGNANITSEWIERWSLVYPLPFFGKLATQCLTNFERYLKANKLDPYGLRTRGEFWLESLNAN